MTSGGNRKKSTGRVKKQTFWRGRTNQWGKRADIIGRWGPGFLRKNGTGVRGGKGYKE